MFESPPIARVAAAIGDPVRAAMLVQLLDGRALTAPAKYGVISNIRSKFRCWNRPSLSPTED